jgi:ankyrin repeat protein
LKRIYNAVAEGNESLVRALVDEYVRSKADDDGILSYAMGVNERMVPILIACGINVDERDTAGNTSLMNASANGQLDLIRWLVAAGADVNAANGDGETAFSFACAWDHLEVAQSLFALGADPSPVHTRGGTPMDNKAHSPRIREFLRRIGA